MAWDDPLTPWVAPNTFEKYSGTGSDASDYHSTSTIELAELIEAGFFDPEDEDWRFDVNVYFKRDPNGYVILGDDGYPEYDEEKNTALYKRLVGLFIDRHMFDEICEVPPSRWRVRYKYIFSTAINNVAQIYRFNDELNVGNRGNSWSKRRNVNSDFPVTAIEDRVEDYARDAQLTEWENLSRDAALSDTLNGYDKWRNPDEEVLRVTDKLFAQIYTHNVNGI